MIYTLKQRELLRLWQKGGLRRMNLLEGSVSSGKTWVSLVLWAFWVASMPEDKPYLMCGKSLTTLKRNCLVLLEELVGKSHFSFSLAAKEGRLFGRRMYLEGANDARSESKIRGMTLQGAYCDELTQFPEDFFTMLLSRLRLPEAKLMATTNPDNPLHWLKTRYINRAGELDFLDAVFSIEDNTTLPEDYVENLKKEYTGVFYERFILGKWVAAQGAVYDMLDQRANVYRPEDRPVDMAWNATRTIAVDYGTSNPTVFLDVYDDGRTIRFDREYRWDSQEQYRQKTGGEYAEDLVAFMRESPCAVLVDPAAASFIVELQSRGVYVIPADNEVLDGIRKVSTLLKNRVLLICSDCAGLLTEMAAYRWDEKAGARGEEKPLKQQDHGPDAVRYYVNSLPDWRFQ